MCGTLFHFKVIVVLDSEHSKLMKVVAVIMVCVVVVFFLSLPAIVFGSMFEAGTDQIAEQMDHMDGQDNFTPGENSGQSTIQKVTNAF